MYLSAEVITKAFCLCAYTTGVCLSMLPPQPKPTDEFRKKYNDPSTACPDEGSHETGRTVTTHLARLDLKAAGAKFGSSQFPYLFSTWVVVMTTLDVFHALDLFPQFMPASNKVSSRVFNMQLVIGLVITITSSALRFTTFISMGRLFTYQLSILPDHKLITHGLYSYVRHPSYTAVVSMFVGVLVTVTAPGGVLYDSLGVESTEKLTVILASVTMYGTRLFVRRADVEDQVLRKEFGKEWDEWAQVVKYKFIPGLI